ncbi:MAG TPA: DUF3710 domain-containing protein [Pseudonocardia sp.]|nr:DUF3710 domain-containing protein [Pseudonocardia sp.]
MSERATEGSEFAEWQPAAAGHPLGEKAASAAGPYDSHDSGAPEFADAVDLGPLLVRLPADAQLLVENTAGTAARTAHLTVPAGKVDLSVLAAPRSSSLWPQVAEEVAAVQGELGARVDTEPGEWGQELRAVSEHELSWFIGVDGPRWMLYGVATGPVEADVELAATLRELLRGTVVRRGPEPLPMKTALTLAPPDTRAAEQHEPAARSTVREPVWFRMGPTPANAALATHLTAVPDIPAATAPEPAAAPGPTAPRPAAPKPAAAVAPDAGANPDQPWPLPAEVPDWRPTVVPTGAAPKRRAGRWALPAGPSVGVAGLVLLAGVGTVLVAVRTTRTPGAASAALPDPATAQTTAPAALPDQTTAPAALPDQGTTPPDQAPTAVPDQDTALPDPATALTNPGPQPTNTLPGLPGLVPAAPPPAVPADQLSESALAGPNRQSARAVEQGHRNSRRAEQIVGTNRSPDDGDDGSSRPPDRSERDEQSAYPGLLGGLVSALNPAQLGIG